MAPYPELRPLHQHPPRSAEQERTFTILDQMCQEHGYRMRYLNDSPLPLIGKFGEPNLIFKGSATFVDQKPVYMTGAASCLGGILFLPDKVLAFHSDVSAPVRLLKETGGDLPPRQHRYRGFYSSAFPSSPGRYKNADYYEGHLNLYYIPPPNMLLGFEYLIVPKNKELYLTHGKQY